jgi:fructose-1,6-bisphosphatase/inositol monophosphatase family enzyme
VGWVVRLWWLVVGALVGWYCILVGRFVPGLGAGMVRTPSHSVCSSAASGTSARWTGPCRTSAAAALAHEAAAEEAAAVSTSDSDRPRQAAHLQPVSRHAVRVRGFGAGASYSTAW